MSRIRKLYYFDKKNMQEMIPFLNNRDAYVGRIMFNPIQPLHHLLPLRFKFLPESYVLKDKNNIKGLITVAPSKCPQKRVELQRLFFEENCYDEAIELIQYAVSKYKAMGVFSIIVNLDESLTELLKVFVAKCNFTEISYEKLWKVPCGTDVEYDSKTFRGFRNSDAAAVSNLYNESLFPHFRPLLSSNPADFKEVILKGLSYFSEYKYIIEDKKSKNIFGYISIKTVDNENFILDIIQSSWEEIDVEAVLNFVFSMLKKRQKKFNLFVKTKKYTQLGEKYEQMFLEHKFDCVQNQIVLTNSSAKLIKDTSSTRRYTVINQFYDGINVPT